MMNQNNIEQTAQDAMPEMSRKVLCIASDGTTIEVPWHLMLQSGTFSTMWGQIDAEQMVKYDTVPLVFLLNEVKAECFERIKEWFGIRDGVPSPVVTNDTLTQERQWFSLTDAERQFFNVDFEVIKELFLAADFLNISSLYLYCAQEFARRIMDEDLPEIREMLRLRDEVDLTDEQEQQIIAEHSIPDLPPVADAESGDANAGEGEAKGDRAAGEANGDHAGDH